VGKAKTPMGKVVKNLGKRPLPASTCNIQGASENQDSVGTAAKGGGKN